MRYAQIRSMDISNGEGIGVALFVQGCHFHCKNCFNQETWDFSGGKEWTQDIKEIFLSMINQQHIQRVSILGGEPLTDENFDSVLDLCKEIKSIFPDKIIWLYSGYIFEEILKNQSKKEIFDFIDMLVDGPFVEDQKDFNLHWKGSSNQRVINVQRSLMCGDVVCQN